MLNFVNVVEKNTLLPGEDEHFCVSFGYSIIKRKLELTKIQRKKINFINRLKDADQKIFVFALSFKKYMKVAIMMNYRKFYPN